MTCKEAGNFHKNLPEKTENLYAIKSSNFHGKWFVENEPHVYFKSMPQ